ncbi:hypothetical protein HanIR_Chr11g0537921 [Helianthus annuus]|nr:hypothetical protein HanIR_Chr11g0537921 [Helianthus annuus]
MAAQVSQAQAVNGGGGAQQVVTVVRWRQFVGGVGIWVLMMFLIWVLMMF